MNDENPELHGNRGRRQGAAVNATPSILGRPVVGARRSLRVIPLPEQRTEPPLVRASSRCHASLLEELRRQPACCRELIRKRLYGLIKNSPNCAAVREIDDLTRSGLGARQYTLLQQFAAETLRGNTALLQNAWLLDYVEVPPSISDFIWGDRFLGPNYQHTDEPGELYPVWEETLQRDFDLDSEIHQLVLTGALAIGKTTVLVLIILYRLCLATLLRNPQQFFGVGRVSRLVFALLSVTKSTARETAFHESLNLMKLSPYFHEICRVEQDLEYAEGRVEMKRHLPDGRPCNLFLSAGSRGQDLLGRNVLGVALDEGNFRLDKDPDRAAYELYLQITNRMASRFRFIAEYQPTTSIIASSAGREWSFTEKIVKEIESADTPRTRRVYRFAEYSVKRHLREVGGLWFRVAYGVPNCDPVILPGYCRETGAPADGVSLQPAPEGAFTELVPCLFEQDYRRDCRSSLQEFSGICTGGTHRAFPEMVHFQNCIELGGQDGVCDPTRPGVVTIPVTMDDDRNIWDYLIPERFLARNSGYVQPLRHPDRKRYVHIDLATRSTAGLAICHLVGRGTRGDQNGRFQLLVEYDFILAFGPGRKPPIYLQKIADFLLWLRNECGFRFGNITADQYQSQMLLQTLQSQGLTIGHLSVDVNKAAYEAWRNAIEGHQIRLYPHPILLKEAEFLQELERKFDHPAGGSKDLCDATAGAHFNAILSDEKAVLTIQNVPSVYGIGAPVNPQPGVPHFGFLEDYMRRNPRPIRVFQA